MSIRAQNIWYWNRRAEGYAQISYAQLQGERGSAWLRVLEEPLQATFPGARPQELRILDVGCGPALFCILLAQRGYRMTGVDYTPNMLARAQANAREHDLPVELVEADAAALPFPDAAFDAVVSRNLTWNLPRPRDAYAEWARVLRAGGVIVNFDANWYRHLFDEEAQRAYLADRARTREAGAAEECEIEGYERMEAIAREVPLGRVERPAWDLATLSELGLRARADEQVWRRVWDAAEQVNFASTPLFRIVAEKPIAGYELEPGAEREPEPEPGEANPN